MKHLTLTLRNARGEVVGELSLEEARDDHNGTPPRQVGPAGPNYNEHGVTEPQRRMLFRLASRLGHDGVHARQYVERRLGPDPDRRAASRLIDDLQEELRREQGGRNAGAA